jgi:CelD/BcsL family acetyltransferase involved in cellulose biosynthesis
MAMVPRGQAELIEVYLGGQLMAVEILVVGNDLVGAYLYGLEPALRNHVDVVVLLHSQGLARTVRLGRPVLSFMRGDEEYKKRWQPRGVRSQRVLLARSGRIRPLYVAAVQMRATVVPFVKHHLPAVHAAARRARKWLASFT